MMPQPLDVREAKRLAERQFLGRDDVVGVGLTEESSQILVFLLSRPSATMQNTIARWAYLHGVGVRFQVVGQIRPAV